MSGAVYRFDGYGKGEKVVPVKDKTRPYEGTDSLTRVAYFMNRSDLGVSGQDRRLASSLHAFNCLEVVLCVEGNGSDEPNPNVARDSHVIINRFDSANGFPGYLAEYDDGSREFFGQEIVDIVRSQHLMPFVRGIRMSDLGRRFPGTKKDERGVV